MLAKYVARALLLVLHRVESITLNAQELQPCQSTHDTSNLWVAEVDVSWRKTSTTHSFPRMTFSQFQCHIEEKCFPSATARGKIVDLLVKAYGLCHVKVLMELKSISNSDFDGRSLFFDDSNDTPWYPGMYLKHYWKSWCAKYPAIADSLEHNFSSMLSTTTVLEQSFSTYNSKADANAPNSSNSSLMRHHINTAMELKKEAVEDAAVMRAGMHIGME